MIKMAALTVAISDALQQRHVAALAARLTAQAGVAVFTTAFDRWASHEASAEFPLLVHEALVELRAAIGAVDPAEPAGVLQSSLPADR